MFQNVNQNPQMGRETILSAKKLGARLNDKTEQLYHAFVYYTVDNEVICPDLRLMS